jgi:hypothetical protein
MADAGGQLLKHGRSEKHSRAQFTDDGRHGESHREPAEQECEQE